MDTQATPATESIESLALKRGMAHGTRWRLGGNDGTLYYGKAGYAGAILEGEPDEWWFVEDTGAMSSAQMTFWMRTLQPCVVAPEIPTTATASHSNQTEKSFEELFVVGSRWRNRETPNVVWVVSPQHLPSIAVYRFWCEQGEIIYIGPPLTEEQVEPSRLEIVRGKIDRVSDYTNGGETILAIATLHDALTLIVEELEEKN